MSKTCHAQGTPSSSPDDERTMGLMSAVLMIIGTLIGTGIFASPGPLFDSVHCTQTSFIIWAFAGVVCTIGAFAYAELGTMFPESGGDFQYLSRAYGKKMALVFGWSFITILNPIGTAGNAGVLGRYSVDMMIYFRTGTSAGIGGAQEVRGMNATGAGSGGSVLNGTDFVAPQAHSPYSPGAASYYADYPKPDHGEEEMAWMVRGFAIGAIVLMGLINVFFKEGGKYASNILALFKVAGMLMLIVIGSIQAVKNKAHSEALSIPIWESSHDVLDYYNGFNNINLGLGELRDPERNLKRAVWIAMPFVTVLFLLANFAFFSILSSHDLRHVHSLSLHAGHTVLGLPGGFLMAGTVVASALGSINANIWGGSRLLVIMAQDNTIIPYRVRQPWKARGTQATAILVLVCQAAVHALISLDFKTFSKIYSAVGWSWYGLSIAGLLYLRKRKPEFPRPMKVYWPLALGFVMVAFFLVVGSLTLAFGGSKTDDGAGHGGGGGGGGGGGRWTSVIMFGGAIVFMSGVVPAFYCTRCYNRRKGLQHGLPHQRRDQLQDNEGSFRKNKEKDHQGQAEGEQQQLRQRGGSSGEVEEGFAPIMVETSKEFSLNISRRHSNASSVTLVDERRRRRRLERLRRQAQRNEGGAVGSLTPEAKTTEEDPSQNSDSDRDDEGKGGKDGITQMVPMRPKYYRNQLGCSTTTLGVPTECSTPYIMCSSPAGPSSWSVSATPVESTAPSPTIASASSEGPQGYFLRLPTSSGSRSSETSLGLQGMHEDDAEETKDGKKEKNQG
ncbi:hypothetical protein BG006_000509 [Podila minutissima]|uniref:Amino acid transporter n=1 Tax=Podila minutissima TaxID=64525 RepID=A0A9P5SE34_9FUNG|nr:hypothetical protein BG006_000509 [Podila minutissima]